MINIAQHNSLKFLSHLEHGTIMSRSYTYQKITDVILNKHITAATNQQVTDATQYQHVTTAKLNSTLQLLHLPAHYRWYRASCDHMGPH